jgi:hypothetical protein
MCGAIPPLHQYAFMAWFSMTAYSQIYLYLFKFLWAYTVQREIAIAQKGKETKII